MAPAFYEVHRDIKAHAHTHYWLKGGRGSGKSSFISLELVLGLMEHAEANAVVLRKVGQTLKESVYAQVLWAISLLGVEAEWNAKLSPLELTYLPTGQKILFRGADNPQKLKSLKMTSGYCRYVWYEETDEFAGFEEIRSINQSLLRGGEAFTVFYSYNPPKYRANWVNAAEPFFSADTLVHHSSYLTVPRDWLGENFFAEAEHLKKVRPEAYRHEYLGEVTGSGGEVFLNLELREIGDAEIAAFDRVKRGLDWGYAADPLHYTVNHYDKTRRTLYIFYEIQERGLSNRRAAEKIRAENRDNREIICDSAEPKSLAEFAALGFRVRGAKKGPDSVHFGLQWLQDLEKIVIDPVRCPNTAREFSRYELLKDANGNCIGTYPDKDNHSIDAVRYSREDDMQRVRVV